MTEDVPMSTSSLPSTSAGADFVRALGERFAKQGKSVLTVEDVLPIVGVSESHLRRQIRAGEFPHRYIGARCVIPVPMFLDWLAGQ